MLSRSVRAGLAIALVVSLTACVETTRLPAAEPSPTVAPLFASDEEALAAATEAYEEYLVVVDGALQQSADGGTTLTDVASGPALRDAEETLASFLADGLRSTGQRVLTHSILQKVDSLPDGTEVRIYVCENAEAVDVLDREGTSVVSPDRPNYTPFEVTVVFNSDLAAVHERLVWGGGGVCEN